MHQRRAALCALAALCVLGFLGRTPSRRGPAPADAWSALPSIQADLPFRLGTAARPFEWSTAVGDVNADGRPDYAIADRVGRGAAGFEYAVQLSISGLPSQSVTFDSPDAALSVSFRDVDHDRDLDIVVSTVVSPTVVHVWLNDGQGRFAETATREEADAWREGASIAADSDGGSPVAVESRSRRSRDALPSRAPFSTGLAALELLTPSHPARLFSPARQTRRSRAPPALASSSL